MILVTAGFGTQGRLLIPKLLRTGVEVRALRRSPDGELPAALSEVEVISGDAADPSVIREAMRGVQTVYHVGPSCHPDEAAMGMAMISAAEELQIEHVVFSSVLHTTLSAIIQHEVKQPIEERLIESGLNFTILQPSDYMQTQLPPPVLEADHVPFPWSVDRRQAVVDVEDVTDVAAKVMLEGQTHHGATYELSAENVTGHEICARLSQVVGREVTPTQFPDGAFADLMISIWGRTGDVTYERRVIESFCGWYDAHDFLGNPNVLRMLLGRDPTSLTEYFEREYAGSQAQRD
jgi:uncharacterized protein YbjT (DUF2867 family)